MIIKQLTDPVGLMFVIGSDPKNVDNEAAALEAIGKLKAIVLKAAQGDSTRLDKKVANERNVLFVSLP